MVAVRRMVCVHLPLVKCEKDPLTYAGKKRTCVSVASTCASQCTSSPTLALVLIRPVNYRAGSTHGQPLIHTILTLLRDVRVRSNEG